MRYWNVMAALRTRWYKNPLLPPPAHSELAKKRRYYVFASVQGKVFDSTSLLCEDVKQNG